MKGLKVMLFLLLVANLVTAQTRQIKGLVKDAANQGVPSATVKVKNGKGQAVTDANGAFSLSVPAGNVVLQISSIGFESKEVSVAGSAGDVSVSLASSSASLADVVVTALGVTKSKRSLNYATQTVETKDLTKARETNVANSLSGKVAGLDVVRSSRGVGSDVRIVLRGDRSFANSSEALIIIDGVPGDLSSLNADDIASMNVLKGSSAAALYGSDASNGVIIIATKKGAAGKGLAVSVNSSTQLDQAVNLRDFQNVYSQGSGGNYIRNSELGWGEKIVGQQVDNWSVNPADAATTKLESHPNNYLDFYSTGQTYTNGVSVTGGGDKIQSFFSYNNISGRGIVDNNTFLRHNFNFRVGGNITDKLSFDTKITYFDQGENNFVKAGEDFSNVNRQILRLPTNIGVDYIKDHYQFRNDQGQLIQNYWNPGSNGGENPMWVKYNTTNKMNSGNVKGLASLTYKFLPNLSLLVRTGLNKYLSNSQDRRFRNTYVIAEEGYYGLTNSSYTEVNNDFLLNYQGNFGDFKLNANAGGNMKTRTSSGLNSAASALVNENVFTLNNAASGKLSSNESYSSYQKNSLYASGDLSYRKYLVLSVTGRNDWSSALPSSNRSYFFGSTGLTAIISDMVKLPDYVSLFKVRTSFAQTGIDAAPYQTKEYFSVTPGGGISKSQSKPAVDLKPELTSSGELGVDLAFLNNRISTDVTLYKTNSKNQLVNVATPPASGYSSKFINAGDVQNKGIEITLNFVPVKTNDFSWSFYVNYARNWNQVISISPNSPEFVLGSDGFMNYTKIVEGKPFGEMYSRGFVRNAAGKVVVLPSGLPQITGAQNVYVGNSRPDWIGGLGNRFTYKDFALSFLVSARIGGVVTSFTDANVVGDGFAAKTLVGRSGWVVDGVTEDGSKNTVETTAEAYWMSVGGRNTPAGEAFTYSASNIRLRELVLSYNIPQKKIAKTPFKGATLSLTGRNLFFLMNKAQGFDPELVVSTASGLIGTESFCSPFTRSLGLNLNLNF
jgi:TonB-linked SusC/RagA family outer membrane protein